MIEKQAQNVRKVKDRTGWGPAASVKVELCLIQGFYAMWKLLKEDLMPDDFTHMQIPMKVYGYKPAKTELKHWRNWRKHYHMNNPQPETHPAEFIANQFVHNALFDIEQDLDGRLGSIYLTSDHQKHKAIYQIDILELIELMEEAAQI